MIYVYAVVEPCPGRPLPPLRGFGDEPVALHAGDEIAVAFARGQPGACGPTAENVWRHEEVVEALMRDRALLPARFGTTFADERELDRVLGRRSRELATRLAQVRGCAELGVRVLAKPASEPPPAPADSAGPSPHNRTGRAYMDARLAAERRRSEEQRRAEAVASALHDALKPGTRGAWRKPPSSPAEPLNAAYLVPCADVDPFVDRVRRLAAGHADLRVLCTGPWPPYHFADPLSPAEAPRV